jgi:hypothetical protein
MIEDIAHELIEEQHKLIRAQKPDPNHTRLTREVIRDWHELVPTGTVLDIGCGQAIARPFWEKCGFEWIGIIWGQDFDAVVESNPVIHTDMHLLGPSSGPILDWIHGVDVIYARHILEHSPFPAVALRRWMEIADDMIVVVPAPEPIAYIPGHISLFPMATWYRIFSFVGLTVRVSKVVRYNNPPPYPQEGAEFRFLLTRAK